MRSPGVCSSIHQSLTPEAATIVKQAINLARRRGHAQVTPIHVATVMLAAPAGLLRSACLKSNSYPIQCKALELCFNVALNRLPATSPTPILGPHHHHHHPHVPALANALMAAFKRAQAHQRRGSIEAQQQPILALKIETDQLVISILDDPSVSRVMREAGFSSTLIKSNIEQSLSHEVSSSQTNATMATSNISNAIMTTSNLKPNYQTLQAQNLSNPFELGVSKPLSQAARSEDVLSVIDAWVTRKEKSSVVLVGECLGSCEGVVKAVKETFQRGDNNVPMELRYVQFLNCPLLAMKNLSREEIDLKLGEIWCLLKGCAGRSGVVLYLGDLKWVAEYWADYNTNSEQQKRQNNYNYYYCPVEHLVMGLRRLVFGNVENGRIWLMAVSTFNSFTKCKVGNPSLETLLDLHALTIPSATLDLSLNLDSSKSSASINTNSSLPSWLQKCKEESSELSTHHQGESVDMKELCKKWGLICSSQSQKTCNFPDKTINFVLCSPSSSPSISSHDDNCKPIISAWPTTVFEPKWASKEHQFLTPNNQTHLFLNTPKPEIISNPNSMPNSASSSETTEPIRVDRFKENNPDNLEALCCALESKVPWQKDIIPEIATTILRCRSGECNRGSRVKQETWLAFLGADHDGKHKLARETAKLVFGAQTSSFKSIGLSSFSTSTRADSSEDCSLKNKKRARHESSHGCIDRLAQAIREDPHRVFFVEDVDQLELGSKKGIKRAMETGKFTLSNGEIVPIEDAIVIFSCDSFSLTSRACSPSLMQKLEEANDHQEERELSNKLDDVDEASSSLPLDLNMAVDDGNDDDNHTVGDIRILEAVDKQVFFSIQVL